MTVKQGKSGRDVVAYFAGHIANLLNGNDQLGPDVDIVSVKAFQLYDKIQHGLLTNRSYTDVLVGVWAYPAPLDPESAAEFYFDSVLDRPIGRRGDAPSSSDNLRALLVAHAVDRFQAPDEPNLSTWKALAKGPPRLKRFRDRQDLFELSNRILRCLDAANRPYAEVLRLGLCPKDWLAGDEAIGVNTLKGANAFLKALKGEMKWDLGRRPRPAEVEAAWAAAPVAGFADAKAFTASLLGSAILTRTAGQDQTSFVSFDLIEAQLGETVADDAEEPLVTSDEALPILDRAVAGGAIAADEKALLAAILEGRPLAEAMRSDLGLRRRLKNEFDGDLEAYVADLSARMAAFVSEN